MANKDIDDTLKRDTVVVVDGEEVRDHRRRTRAPEGIIVGSNEYWRWWRQNNQSRNKLYQRRAYLKRRKLTMASARSGEKETTVEDELEEIDAQIEALREFAESNKVVPKKPLQEIVNKTAFIDDEAQKYNIPYEVAEKFMYSNDWDGTPECWQAFLLTYPPADENS